MFQNVEGTYTMCNSGKILYKDNASVCNGKLFMCFSSILDLKELGTGCPTSRSPWFYAGNIVYFGLILEDRNWFARNQIH
jgi:hypothetical protein